MLTKGHSIVYIVPYEIIII